MNKILFLDILTTGLNIERCAIYRTGGVICQESEGVLKEIKRFDICARPSAGTRIIDNSLWVGGMTRSKLAYLPEQEEAFRQLTEILHENVSLKNPKDKIYLSGFNTSAFDMPFLRSWFVQNRNEDFRNIFHMQCIDLMSIAAFSLMNEREGMQDFHLETTARMFGISPRRSDEYSPLDNVDTCISLYLELQKRLMPGRQTEHAATAEVFKNHKF